MTHISDDDELTPEEAAAFAALPRATGGHDQLAEERAIQALRRAKLLPRSGRPLMTWGQLVGTGVAAALFFFTVGALFGRQLAAREVRTASPSMQVQQAGTAYVAALVRLSRATDTERTPGLEAGAATLRAAASSLALVSPNDPVARRIRTSLNNDDHPANDHSVIWF